MQDHLVKASSEVLATLMASENLLLPADDPVVSGGEHWSTKGQASKALRVVLASNRLRKAGSLHLSKRADVLDDSKVDNAVGVEGGQHGTGSS